MADIQKYLTWQNVGYWMKTPYGCILTFLTSYYILRVVSCECLITLGILLIAKKLSSFVNTIVWNFAPKVRISPDNKAVFVTGCDSGFGHEAAKLLDQSGFTVYAGCLFPTENGAQSLKKNCSKKLQIVALDVTSEELISSALQTVKDTLKDKELWAIVNNAGIGDFSMLEWCSLELYRNIHEVNAFGPVQVTNAFLPLLKKSKGRIVNVVSILGTFSWPGTVPYCMSKHAALAFTNGLRQELKQFGITAHSILPVLYNTSITDCKTRGADIDRNWEPLSVEIKKSYGENYAKELQDMLQKTSTYGVKDITEVAQDIVNAVSDTQPQDSYIPGFILEVGAKLFQSLPNKIRDYVACYYLPRVKPEDGKSK